jgi:HEAT repeat protein
VWICKLNRALLAVAVCALPAPSVWAQDRPALDRAGPLIENLRAENVDVRRGAASELRMSDRNVQREAVPALIERLEKDKDGQVRLAVLDTLAALGPDAVRAVPALVHSLETDFGGQGSEASHQDYRSALALAAIGQPAVEGLRGLLKAKKESVRAEAAMALGRIGRDAEQAAPDLIVLLADKSERIRLEASRSLGRIGTPALTPLFAAAEHKDAIVRAGAVESLGYLSAPDERVRRALISCAHDAAQQVRAAAVKSLGRLPVPDDVLLPTLEENVGHEDDQVRLAVVNLLVERRAILRRLAPELESLLAAKNDGVSRHAAFLLGKIGADVAPRLLAALHHDNSRIDQIAEALAQIGRPVGKLLTGAAKDPDPRVRRGAALALGQIRPLGPGTATALAAGLDDADPLARAACLTAIGYLGARAGECVPAVRVMLGDKSAEIRIQAIHILYQSAPRDDRLLSDLMDRLDDSDARVQRQAIDVIRSLGPPGRKALSVIIGKLGSADPEVRVAAAEMIGSHGQAAAAAVPALSSLLDDPAPKVRTIAVQTLGSMGKAAQPALARVASLLEAEQVEVRQAAALALGSMDLDAEVVRPHLGRALRDSKPEVRRVAMRSIQKLGSQGAIFIPDIILMAEKKENLRSVERMLRRFERSGPDVRSLPELVEQLKHDQDTVRLLAIKFLGLAGQSARDAIPALERMREDPSAEVRKQALAASEQIKGRSAERAQGNKRSASG